MALYDPDPVVRRNATFTAGVLAGALVLAVVWGTLALVHSGGTTSADGDESGTLAAAVVSTREAAPCRAVFAAQTAPLRTATKSLRGWRVHIEAMNRLVTGEITLEQARAFWRVTRVAATGLLAGYDRADRRFDHRAFRCPRPLAGAQTDLATSTCRRAVLARDAVLRRAATAMATWRTHMHHMEMLREGTITPTEAIRLWRQSWRIGMREMSRYDLAVRRAGSAGC